MTNQGGGSERSGARHHLQPLVGFNRAVPCPDLTGDLDVLILEQPEVVNQALDEQTNGAR